MFLSSFSEMIRLCDGQIGTWDTFDHGLQNLLVQDLENGPAVRGQLDDRNSAPSKILLIPEILVAEYEYIEFAIQYCEQLTVLGSPERLPLDTGDHMIGENVIGE